MILSQTPSRLKELEGGGTEEAVDLGDLLSSEALAEEELPTSAGPSTRISELPGSSGLPSWLAGSPPLASNSTVAISVDVLVLGEDLVVGLKDLEDEDLADEDLADDALADDDLADEDLADVELADGEMADEEPVDGELTGEELADKEVPE